MKGRDAARAEAIRAYVEALRGLSDLELKHERRILKDFPELQEYLEAETKRRARPRP